MRYRKPEYYDTFQCAAGQCPDTCCAGWQIAIDEDSLEKYGALKGDFRNRLINGIDWLEGCFLQHKGECCLLNEEKLCDLVIECGEDFLCETCAQYPRHVEEFKGVRERTLSLSCPVAAKIILEQQTPVHILEEEDDLQDPLLEEFEEFDDDLMKWLETERTEMLRIAQDRSKSVDERMAVILTLAERMQRELESRAPEGTLSENNAQNSYTKESRNETEQSERIRFVQIQQQFAAFERLMCLRDEWQQVIDSATVHLFRDYEAYSQIRRAFLKELEISGERCQTWESMRENLLVFFLFTYFCGAVYDDCVYSKAALSVFSVIFVSEFVMCRWYLADNYNDKQDFANVAYRYARELEHSDYNLDTLEEWLMENPIRLRGTEIENC